VILYALLCGSLPFDDENIPNLFKKIKGGIFTLPGHMSDEIKDLISRMLVVDPLQRITIPEIRRHRWFMENLPLYLSVTPDQIMSQFRALDQDVLMEVVMKIGFDRKDLLDALQKQALYRPSLFPIRTAISMCESPQDESVVVEALASISRACICCCTRSIPVTAPIDTKDRSPKTPRRSATK